MTFHEEKAADASAILAEIGESVTWNGQVFSALVSDPALAENLEIGGFVGDGSFTIKILRSAFSTSIPKLGQRVLFEGGTFRIERVSNHPRYPMVVLVVSPED